MGYDPTALSDVYAGMTHFFCWRIDLRGNIIGNLFACVVGGMVKQQIRKIMSKSLDMILTSVLTLIVVGAVTYLIIILLRRELFLGML